MAGVLEDAARAAWPARDARRLLGRDLRRIDGPDKVTGRARYTHDVRLPGMVYARLLLSPHPVAEVEVDTAAALALDGVVDARVVGTGRVIFLGQPVAAVAATTAERADDALRALTVTWKPGPFSVTPEQSQAPGAAPVGSGGNVRADRREGADDDAAEVARAFEACDAVVEATYDVPVQHHTSLETHGVVVDFRGGGEATVYASTQGTFVADEAVAEPLGLEGGAVTTLVEHMGGGFGAKLQFGVEGLVACEIARDLKRPVHLMLTRADEFLMAGNRSGARQHVRGGATRAGELVALEARVDRHGGIARGSHPGLPYVYAPAVHSLELRSVLTHTDGSRAFRAPGHPQASFAMESLMDELAYAIGMDPLEFRKANLPAATAATYRRQLDSCAAEIGWADHPHRTAPAPVPAAAAVEPVVGIGFGVAVWGGGGRRGCEVEVRLRADGSVTVLSGSQDLGTGTRTFAAAIVAEALGLDLDAVSVRIGDSRLGFAPSSGGSHTAASLAPAVQDAATGARRALLDRVAAARGWHAETLELRGGRLLDASDASRSLGWAEACAVLGPGGLSARGVWREELADEGTQGAQAARVAVDPQTGAVRVLRMVAVHNCGLVLNRLATRSQIQGGMIQALSYGLFEQRVIDPDLGVLLSANFDDYKLAGPQEIPDLHAVIEEDPRGVIGIGEPPIIPGHSAIANAVHNACGVRIRSLPLTPDKVLDGLAAARLGGAR